MMDYPLETTFTFRFSTRAFATGIPTALAGTPILSYMADGTDTALTAGLTFAASSVAGLNLCTIAATAANGFAAGSSYDVYISQGTVGGVSAVGEVVGSFSIGRDGVIETDVNNRVTMTDWLDGGRLDVLIDAIKAKTDDITFTAANLVDSNIIKVASGTDLVEGGSDPTSPIGET